MQKSYTKNFINIYFWQGISVLLNFLSMFIVTPRLTSQPGVYGTFMVCISATIFLTYADLGFVSSCSKYASEFFGAKKTEDEVKTTAFGAFILFIFVAFISIFFFILSLHPEFLFAKFSSIEEKSIASTLFLILSLFSFNIVFQRIIQIIYGIRLEDYIFQRVNIVLAIIKIGSVFYFFRPGFYDIIGYFFFFQLISVLGSMVSILIVKLRYNYDINLFIKSFRFSKEQYLKTKNLAFSSLYLTILWIIYYELDSFVIAKFLGTEHVAYFAVAFSLMAVFRTIFGTLYNPFAARFNHFVGTNDIEGLKTFFINVITITLPIVLFPILAVLFLMKPFILCWVGEQYTSSILVASLLISSYLLSYVSYPASLIITALEKLKQIYLVNTVIVIIFCGGVILTINKFNIVSFGLFKCLAFLISGLMYVRISIQFTGLNIRNFMNQIFKPVIIPICVMSAMLLLGRQYLPLNKDKFNLIIVIFVGFIAIVTSMVIYFFCSQPFRSYVIDLKNKYVNK